MKLLSKVLALIISIFCLQTAVADELIPEIPGALYGIEVELNKSTALASMTKYYNFNTTQLKKLYLEWYQDISFEENVNFKDPINNYLINNPKAYLQLPEFLQKFLIGDESLLINTSSQQTSALILPGGKTHEYSSAENPILKHLGSNSSLVWQRVLLSWNKLTFEEKYESINLNNLKGSNKALFWHEKILSNTNWNRVDAYVNKLEIKTDLPSVQYELLSRLNFHRDQDAVEFTYLMPVPSVNQMYKDLKLLGALAGLETYITNPMLHIGDNFVWGSMHHHLSLSHQIPHNLVMLMNLSLAMKRISMGDIEGLKKETRHGFTFSTKRRGLFRILNGNQYEQRAHFEDLKSELKKRNELFLMPQGQAIQVLTNEINNEINKESFKKFVEKYKEEGSTAYQAVQLLNAIRDVGAMQLMYDAHVFAITMENSPESVFSWNKADVLAHLEIISKFLSDTESKDYYQSILDLSLAHKIKNDPRVTGSLEGVQFKVVSLIGATFGERPGAYEFAAEALRFQPRPKNNEPAVFDPVSISSFVNNSLAAHLTPGLVKVIHKTILHELKILEPKMASQPQGLSTYIDNIKDLLQKLAAYNSSENLNFLISLTKHPSPIITEMELVESFTRPYVNKEIRSFIGLEARNLESVVRDIDKNAIFTSNNSLLFEYLRSLLVKDYISREELETFRSFVETTELPHLKHGLGLYLDLLEQKPSAPTVNSCKVKTS